MAENSYDLVVLGSGTGGYSTNFDDPGQEFVVFRDAGAVAKQETAVKDPQEGRECLFVGINVAG